MQPRRLQSALSNLHYSHRCCPSTVSTLPPSAFQALQDVTAQPRPAAATRGTLFGHPLSSLHAFQALLLTPRCACSPEIPSSDSGLSDFRPSPPAEPSGVLNPAASISAFSGGSNARISVGCLHLPGRPLTLANFPPLLLPQTLTSRPPSRRKALRTSVALFRFSWYYRRTSRVARLSVPGPLHWHGNRPARSGTNNSFPLNRAPCNMVFILCKALRDLSRKCQLSFALSIMARTRSLHFGSKRKCTCTLTGIR